VLASLCESLQHPAKLSLARGDLAKSRLAWQEGKNREQGIETSADQRRSALQESNNIFDP
jgi:hypothetical protein